MLSGSTAMMQLQQKTFCQSSAIDIAEKSVDGSIDRRRRDVEHERGAHVGMQV